MVYIVLGHRISGRGADLSGIGRLACAMQAAAVAAAPFAPRSAPPGFSDPGLLLAAAGVGVSSSVVPYVRHQVAMARLPRASFALRLTLLPASADGIGVLVLSQTTKAVELLGIALVIGEVPLHRASER